MSDKRNYSVFISFSSEDKEQAYELCKGIEAHGLQCFVADRDVPPGANFANEIVVAIMKAPIFALIVSEASIRSPHVRREVSLAIEEGCRIIPLSFGQSPKKLPEEWRYWLSAVQIVRLERSEESAIVVVSALKDFEAPSETAIPIRDSVLDDHVRVENRDANLDFDLGIENFQSGSLGSPSTLLRAEAAAVEFIGREEEITRLNAWLALSNRFLTRLVVGPGGVGKTRLARELCLQAERTGWRTAFVGPDAVIEETIRSGSASALFVLDYAETRPSDVVKLIALLRTSSLAKARLLLLARSDGDWWTSLLLKSPELESILTSSLPMKLGTLNTPGVANQVYKAALRAFSNSLGTPEPQVDRHRQFAVDSSPLELQTIALLDVLDASGAIGPDLSQPPSERLLNHERRYFKNAVSTDGIEGMDTIDLDRVLAIMTLLGAESEAEALENIERLGCHLKSTSAKKLVRLLRRLYSSPGRYFSGLRPDIIAEELISQVVEGSGHYSEAAGFPVDMVRGASSSQLERAFTVLGNAARYGHVRAALVAILTGLSDGVAEAAIRVATRLRSPEPLVDAFKTGLTSKKHSRERLLSLLKEIPDETVALADVAADLCKVLVQMDGFEANGTPNSIETARFLVDASNRFSDVGRLNDAIETVRKGIEIQKGLQQTDSVRLELGAMLSNLSNRLWDAGHVDAALEPAKESVALFKGIDGEVVKELRYRKFFAAATSNLAFRLADVGQFELGLRAVREAVTKFNSLNEIRERFVESGAVSAMNNLVCLLNATGDFCDAIDVAKECMDRRRRQVSQDRDRFLPFFARTLNNAAISYLGCGDQEGAQELGHESFELLLMLSGNRPMFTRDLSISGLNLAAIHASRGSDELAVDTIEIVLKRAFQGTQLTPPDNRIKVALEVLKDALLGVRGHERTVLRPINGSSCVPSADIPFGLALEYKDL